MGDQTGLSLVELTAVIAVIGLSVGAAGVYMQPASAPVETGATLLENYFRLARARATATTSAYRIGPASSTSITAEHAGSCSASNWTSDAELTLDLPHDVTLSSTGWTVCFTSRGAATSNLVVTLTHPLLHDRRVEVLRGGSTRILP